MDSTNSFIPAASYIAYEENIFNIDLMENIDGKKYTELESNTAYLLNGIFYILRGNKRTDRIMDVGIYAEENGDIFISPPITEVDNAKYSIDKYIIDTSKEKIIEVLKTKDILYIAPPDGADIFNPSITDNDDVLKRVVKRALQEKNVDLDLYKERFIDKNTLFNFKQLLKKENGKISIKIFERGCEVLNLKFTIIVEEIDNDNSVGIKLKQPIIITSEETFQI